jgi:hypothetical protein
MTIEYDDITIMPHKEGSCLVWDFTYPATLASGHFNQAVTRSGDVANDA